MLKYAEIRKIKLIFLELENCETKIIFINFIVIIKKTKMQICVKILIP